MYIWPEFYQHRNYILRFQLHYLIVIVEKKFNPNHRLLVWRFCRTKIKIETCHNYKIHLSSLNTITHTYKIYIYTNMTYIAIHVKSSEIIWFAQLTPNGLFMLSIIFEKCFRKSKLIVKRRNNIYANFSIKFGQFFFRYSYTMNYVFGISRLMILSMKQCFLNF